MKLRKERKRRGSKMSRNFYEKDGLILTSFYGGKERGRCLQLNIVNLSSIQLDRDSTMKLYEALGEWIDGEE